MNRVLIKNSTPPSKELGLYVPIGDVLATAVGDFKCCCLKRSHMHSCEFCALKDPDDPTNGWAFEAICKRLQCCYTYRKDRSNVIFVDTRTPKNLLGKIGKVIKQ